MSFIDVWDTGTYDAELTAILTANADLIRDYHDTSHKSYIEREASDHTMAYPENPFGQDYMDLTDSLGPIMTARTIRAWHYTRLTDVEVETLRRDGIHLSTPETLQARLMTQIEAGALTTEQAEAIVAGSPLQSDQRRSRSNKFWMTSNPYTVDDGGVELLLESWGGEVAYFWQRDPALQELLKGLGRPRVLEVAAPLASSGRSHWAGRSVIYNFARSLGCRADSGAFDFYTVDAVGPEAVLAIHTEGAASFTTLGQGYPARYVRPE